MTYSKSVAVWLSEGQITCVRDNSFLLHLRKVCLNSQLGIGLGQICPEKREPSPTDAVALAPVSKEHRTVQAEASALIPMPPLLCTVRISRDLHLLLSEALHSLLRWLSPVGLASPCVLLT